MARAMPTSRSLPRTSARIPCRMKNQKLTASYFHAIDRSASFLMLRNGAHDNFGQPICVVMTVTGRLPRNEGRSKEASLYLYVRFPCPRACRESEKRPTPDLPYNGSHPGPYDPAQFGSHRSRYFPRLDSSRSSLFRSRCRRARTGAHLRAHLAGRWASPPG